MRCCFYYFQKSWNICSLAVCSQFLLVKQHYQKRCARKIDYVDESPKKICVWGNWVESSYHMVRMRRVNKSSLRDGVVLQHWWFISPMILKVGWKEKMIRLTTSSQLANEVVVMLLRFVFVLLHCIESLSLEYISYGERNLKSNSS